jgi:hypothetical protein
MNVQKSRILYTKPSITELEVRYATDAATKGWGDQCYAYIDRFEELFKPATPDFVLILPWNLRDEVMMQLAYVRDWGGQFVTAVLVLQNHEELKKISAGTAQ